MREGSAQGLLAVHHFQNVRTRTSWDFDGSENAGLWPLAGLLLISAQVSPSTGSAGREAIWGWGSAGRGCTRAVPELSPSRVPDFRGAVLEEGTIGRDVGRASIPCQRRIRWNTRAGEGPLGQECRMGRREGVQVNKAQSQEPGWGGKRREGGGAGL